MTVPSIETLIDCARRTDSPATLPEVIDILRERSAELRSDPSRDDALERLAKGAVVVATGQQPGLFGGPLLSLLKTASAIQWARSLAASGVDAVPLFWNASEDHDLDEANRLFLHSDDGTTVLHHLELEGSSLDRVPLSSEHVSLLRAWIGAAGLEVDEEDFPSAGETVGAWCTRLMAQRFHGEGLLTVEPAWIAPLLGPHRRALLDRRGEIREIMEVRHVALRESGETPGLETPSAEATHLFHVDDVARRPLLAGGSGWRAGDLEFSDGEIEELLATSAISSSVVARPLAQRAILPVVAQVCGPSELRYLREIEGTFGAMGTEAPVLIRRTSATLVEALDWHALEPLGASLETAPPPLEDWPPAPPKLPPEAEEDLAGVAAAVHEAFDLAPEVSREARHESRRLVRDLRKKLERAWKKRVAPAKRLRHRLSERIFPRGRSQDRVLSLVSFAEWPTRYLVRRILGAAKPGGPEHVMIVLETKEKRR